MRELDFPIERAPAEAWPDFAGWRVNYERAAYAVAEVVDAPPALCRARTEATCVPRNSGGLEAMILGLTCGNASRRASEACL